MLILVGLAGLLGLTGAFQKAAAVLPSIIEAPPELLFDDPVFVPNTTESLPGEANEEDLQRNAGEAAPITPYNDKGLNTPSISVKAATPKTSGTTAEEGQAKAARKAIRQEAQRALRKQQRQVAQEARQKKVAERLARKKAEKDKQRLAKAAKSIPSKETTDEQEALTEDVSAVSVETAPTDPAAEQPAGEQAVEQETQAAEQTPPEPEQASEASAEKTAESDDAPSADSETSKAFESLPSETRKQLEALSEAIQQEHQAIYNELRDEEEVSLTEIALLWQAAVERSGTIRFAIEKLSRRDATGRPEGPTFTKRVLQSITRLGGVAGTMWTGTPAGVLSGNLVEELMQGDPSESALRRVTDADMLLLAKEVESLQSQVIQSYYSYRHAEGRWKQVQEAKRTLGKYYEQPLAMQSSENEVLQPILDSLFESIKQEETTAKQTFISARNALGLLVGGDALLVMEKANPSSNVATKPAQLKK